MDVIDRLIWVELLRSTHHLLFISRPLVLSILLDNFLKVFYKTLLSCRAGPFPSPPSAIICIFSSWSTTDRHSKTFFVSATMKGLQVVLTPMNMHTPHRRPLALTLRPLVRTTMQVSAAGQVIQASAAATSMTATVPGQLFRRLTHLILKTTQLLVQVQAWAQLPVPTTLTSVLMLPPILGGRMSIRLCRQLIRPIHLSTKRSDIGHQHCRHILGSGVRSHRIRVAGGQY